MNKLRSAKRFIIDNGGIIILILLLAVNLSFWALTGKMSAINAASSGWIAGLLFSTLLERNSRKWDKKLSDMVNPRFIHNEPTLYEHVRGVSQTGLKFVSCPKHKIYSWSNGDYDNKWCHACKRYF